MKETLIIGTDEYGSVGIQQGILQYEAYIEELYKDTEMKEGMKKIYNELGRLKNLFAGFEIQRDSMKSIIINPETGTLIIPENMSKTDLQKSFKMLDESIHDDIDTYEGLDNLCKGYEKEISRLENEVEELEGQKERLERGNRYVSAYYEY